MASIFKRDGRDGKPAAKYSIKYKDEHGNWKTVIGCADLESTRRLAKKYESEATLRRSGVVVESDLKSELPIKAFWLHLKAKGSEDSHVDLTIAQVEAICAACCFETLNDLRQSDAADKVNLYLKNKKRPPKRKPTEELTKKVVYAEPEKLGPISARTRNAYIVSLKSFCKWCVITGKMPDCGLIHGLKRAKQSEKAVRRAATDAELDRILVAAFNGEIVAGLTGEQRYYLYRVATATGFRASELRSLCPSAFKLKGAVPVILLAADDAKNDTEAHQPIRPEFAAELAKWLPGRPANQPVWPGLWHKKAAEMLREDLQAAGVKYRDNMGRVLDFHALRGTFITSLSRAGVHPKMAQILARHSDINLTMKNYTHLSLAEVAAVLPERAPPAHQGSGKKGHSVSLRVTSKKRA